MAAHRARAGVAERSTWRVEHFWEDRRHSAACRVEGQVVSAEVAEREMAPLFELRVSRR
jgi:hypothetical protein